MKIEDAASHVGKRVIYSRDYCEVEHGVITSVSPRTVFVRYDHQHPTAPGQGTDPEDLVFE